MRNPAFVSRSHIRSVVLCTLVTFGLTACASDAGSGASTAASASSGSLVAPSVGVIDRSVTTGTTPSVTTVASTGTGSKPVTTTPPVTIIPPVGTAPPPTPVTGTATLDWTPPTENSDGSALTNLAGYTVYYGTAPDRLTESVQVSNPGLTAYTVSNLTSGTWYFAVTAYSSTGVESIRSGVISTKI